MLNDGTAFTCGNYNGFRSSSSIVNLGATCKVGGSRKRSRCRLDGWQATHCLDPGALQDDIVRTIGTDATNRVLTGRRAVP